jgi:hypothetical protein
MRKITVELHPKYLSNIHLVVPENFFESCEYIEGKTLLKVDLDKGVKMIISEIHMRPGFSLDDLIIPKIITILDVLKKVDNRYTCLIKAEYEGEILELAKKFDIKNVVFDLPASLSKERLEFSFIGDNETVKTLLPLIKTIGPIKINSIHDFVSDFDVLSYLTDRQKEIILLAKKNGYYEMPRKITTEKLSEKLGVSKSTIIEHLRKAENRIVSSLLEGR